MNWGAISAIVAALAGLATLFMWILKILMERAIAENINGFKSDFKTKHALQDQRLDRMERDVKELYDYSHTLWHEKIERFSDSLLEAVKVGEEMGRKASREAK